MIGAVVGRTWLDPRPSRFRDFTFKFLEIEVLNRWGSLSKVWLKKKNNDERKMRESNEEEKLN